MQKWLHNISGSVKNYGHGDIADDAFWQIPSQAVNDRLTTLPTLLEDVSSGDIVLSLDGSTDYEGNSAAQWAILLGGEVSIKQSDPDTGGLAMSPKWAPQGWAQVYHEIEFKTSQLNAIHDKGIDGNDKGFTTAKFYDADGVELTTQETIDTDCVKTIIDFMPTSDYAIKSGRVAQITSPSEGVYLWAFLPLSELGMADKAFCDGGINLEFVDSKTLVGLDGTAATLLPYYGGVGTNKLRFLIRHSAGFKHRIQVIFEYFKA